MIILFSIISPSNYFPTANKKRGNKKVKKEKSGINEIPERKKWPNNAVKPHQLHEICEAILGKMVSANEVIVSI